MSSSRLFFVCNVVADVAALALPVPVRGATNRLVALEHQTESARDGSMDAARQSMLASSRQATLRRGTARADPLERGDLIVGQAWDRAVNVGCLRGASRFHARTLPTWGRRVTFGVDRVRFLQPLGSRAATTRRGATHEHTGCTLREPGRSP